MTTSGRISGQSAGSGAGSAGSRPARSTWSKDKKRMAVLDRKCSKAWRVFHLWRNFDLDPRKFPGNTVAKAKKEFAKDDAKRKALRHKMKGVKPR